MIGYVPAFGGLYKQVVLTQMCVISKIVPASSGLYRQVAFMQIVLSAS